jgi:A/G-specific adenine glycosylase
MESGFGENAEDLTEFQLRILDWYGGNQRALPWRIDPSPYRVWISEIMLQQTQAATVLRYYDRFLRRFPDLNSLAQASEDEILELWAGLGYYRRARNLLKAAGLISRKQGIFPSDLKEILKLPGVGKYTAGAICSIAFNQPEPVVDGNVRRVITRLAGIRRRVPEKFFWNQMRSWMPENRTSEFNQSMMELGALICTPLNPGCTQCPVRIFCIAHKKGITNSLPKARMKKAMQRVRIVTLLLHRRGKFLLTSGNDYRFIPGKWGLPYEMVLNGDGPADIAKNLCRRVLGKNVPLQECTVFRHSISRRIISVHGYFGQIPGGIPEPTSRYRWANRETAPLVSSLYRKMLGYLPENRPFCPR